MEDNETIVIDIQLDEAGIQKRLAEVGTSIRSVEAANRQLKQSIKESGDEFGINAKLMAQNEVLLKSLKAEQSALSGQVKASVQSYQKYGTSIKELTAKMNALKEEYRSLNREDRESDIGQSLKQQIGELRQEINEANHSLGDFQDNVGNYPDAVQPATEQLKELTKAIIEMKMAGKEGTEEYTEMVKKAGELKDAIGDTNQEIKQMASDTSALDSVLQGAQATAGLFSTALGVMNLVGEKDSKTAKQLAEAQQKLQAAIAITTGLQSVQNALQKNSALMMGIQRIQTIAAAKAQDMYAAATGRATIAQRIFNAAAKANPYVLLAMAIITVVGAIAAFVGGSKEQDKQVKNTNNELNNHLQIIKYMQEQYKGLGKIVEDNIQTKLDEAKATGKSTEEIRKYEDQLYEARMANLKKQREELGLSMVQVTAYEEQYKDALGKIKILEENRIRALIEHDEESEIYFVNEINRIKITADHLKGMIDSYRSVNNEISNLSNENKARQAERDKEDAEQAKAAAEKAKAAAEKRKEIEEKRIQETRQLQKAYNQFVTDELRNQVSDYAKSMDDEIRDLQHRLDTEKKLTISERAEINEEIIKKELEKNEEVARMNRDLAEIEAKTQRDLANTEIDDKLKQLKEEGVLTDEIRAQYEEQRKNNQVKYEEDIARIAEQYTSEVTGFKLEAEKQMLDNAEELTVQSYERREELRQIEAEKRILEAGKDEELIAAAELQNAIEENAALLSLDEETKLALGMSQEQYELAVLQSEKNIQDAKEKTFQVEKKNAAMQMKAYGDIFDGMSNIVGQFSKENEALAQLEKTISLAKIAMSTGVAIAEGVAAAQDVPYPANLVAVATTVATIMANIATAISTVKGAKFAEGGIVAGTSYYGDQVNARLNSGEMVLNREQQANLFRMIEQPRTIGSTAELTEAFSAALSEMPNPVLEYTEFRQFTENVNEQTNKTIIR